jgi:hypothetical protein
MKDGERLSWFRTIRAVLQRPPFVAVDIRPLS